MKKLLSNKLIKILFSLAILLVSAISAYSFAPSREILVQANHAIYKDASKLEGYADMIIVGELVDDFSKYKPTIIYNSAGRIADFYTVTDVKHSKVLKGQIASQTLSVLQSAVLLDKPYKAKKDLLISEDMTLMEKGKKYLLFLKATDLPGVYSIVSLNQGKFNIDNLDLKEKEMERTDEQFKTLKQDVLNKFIVK